MSRHGKFALRSGGVVTVRGQRSAENSHSGKGQNQGRPDQQETRSKIHRPQRYAARPTRSGGVGVTVEEAETGELDQSINDPVATAKLEAIGRTMGTDQDAQS